MAVMIAGCASVVPSRPPGEAISEKRRERNQAVVRQFDQKRDWAEFEAAQARSSEGDFRGSAEILKRLLERNPNHLQARLLMAESLLADNRPREAIPYLEPAVAANPNDARVHHMMGLLLDSIGQRADALVYYEQATRLRPHNEVYAVSYQMLNDQSQNPSPPTPLSASGARGGRSIGATSDEEPQEQPKSSPPRLAPTSGATAIEPNTLSSDTPRLPGHVSNRLGGQAPEHSAPEAKSVGSVGAAGFAQQSDLSTDPAVASASEVLQKGMSAMSDGMNALGFAYFREAMAARPHDPQIPISAAICALQHNQPDIAVTLLEPVLEVFSDSVAIRRILGAAYYRLGDYQSSQVVLRQALSLDKSNALSYFLMGCTLVKLGQPAVAETHFRQARRLDPRYAFPH